MIKFTVIFLIFVSFVSVSYGQICAGNGNSPTTSTCDASDVTDTTLTDSTVNDSTVKTSTLTTTKIKEGSCVQGSTLTDSTVTNSTLFKVTITGSTVTNRVLCDCTVTGNNFDACTANCPEISGCPRRSNPIPTTEASLESTPSSSGSATSSPSGSATPSPSAAPKPSGSPTSGQVTRKPCQGKRRQPAQNAENTLHYRLTYTSNDAYIQALARLQSYLKNKVVKKADTPEDSDDCECE